MVMIPYKWVHDPRRRIIYSRQTVTNQDVEDIVDWAIDAIDDTPKYRVWSGVHGVPGGWIQVDDDDFYEIDKRELAVKYPHYKVTVHKMDVVTLPPHDMQMHLNDREATVILAWCYSEGFLP
jgi:hypothetical protein